VSEDIYEKISMNLVTYSFHKDSNWLLLMS
jgi:hypothetical protein